MKPCFRCGHTCPDECIMLVSGILKKTDAGDFKAIEVEGYLCPQCLDLIEGQEPSDSITLDNITIYT